MSRKLANISIPDPKKILGSKKNIVSSIKSTTKLNRRVKNSTNIRIGDDTTNYYIYPRRFVGPSLRQLLGPDINTPKEAEQKLLIEKLQDYGEIYCIVNCRTNMKYIGQTKCLKKRGKKYIYSGYRSRFQIHLKNAFNNNYEDCPKLYRAISECGELNFYIYLLERCLRSELNKQERYYIRKYKTRRRGYNTTTGGQFAKYARHSKSKNKKKWTSKKK